MPTATLDLPTKYHLEAQPDGKVLIRGVPIFAETTERDGKKLPYGVDWMRAALTKAQAQPGYWSPMHYRHHGEGVAERTRAGDLRQEEIVRRIVDGKETWVTLATLRFDSEADARTALAKFPYRSVEIVPDKPDEINSLALLSSEAPFHRFPNLAFAAAWNEADHPRDDDGTWTDGSGSSGGSSASASEQIQASKERTRALREQTAKLKEQTAKTKQETAAIKAGLSGPKAENQALKDKAKALEDEIAKTKKSTAAINRSIDRSDDADQRKTPADKQAWRDEQARGFSRGIKADLVKGGASDGAADQASKHLGPAKLQANYADWPKIPDRIRAEGGPDSEAAAKLAEGWVRKFGPPIKHSTAVVFSVSEAGGVYQTWRDRLMADDSTPADDKDEKGGERMEAAPPAAPAGGDVNARLAALEAGMAKCLAALQPAAPATAPAAPKPVARSPIVAAQTTGPGTRFATDGEAAGQVSLETTKAETERDLLAERLEALELERATEKKLAAFTAELEPYGFTTAKKEKLLACLARGEEHARLYVDTVKAHAPKIQRAPRISTSPDAEPGDPPEVAAYATRGPEALRLARESAVTFRAMPANVRATVAGDLKTWLKSDDRGPGPLEA